MASIPKPRGKTTPPKKAVTAIAPEPYTPPTFELPSVSLGMFDTLPTDTPSSYNFGLDGSLSLDDTAQFLPTQTSAFNLGLDNFNLGNYFAPNGDVALPAGLPASTNNPSFFQNMKDGMSTMLGLKKPHTLEELKAMGPAGLEALKAQNQESLLNRQAFGQTLQGLNSLMSGYLGYQGMKQAKDALDFQRTSWAKNFENQRRSYNTELEDKYRRSTGMSSNFSEADLNEYMKKNSL